MTDTLAPPRPASRLRQLRGVLRLVVPPLLFLAAIVALAGGGRELASYDLHVHPPLAVAAFAMLVCASAWASVVWTFMARRFGARLGWRNGVKVYTTSNLGKYLPGKVGHVVARVYLAQERGVPLAIGTTAAAVDIVLYVGAAMVFGVLSLPLLFPAYGQAATAVGILCILAGLGLLHPRVLNRILGTLARRLPGGARFHLECGYGTILALFAAYLVLIALTTLGMFLAFSALQPLSWLSITQLGASYGVSYMAGLVFPLAPNGVGVREGVMATLLSGMMPIAVAGAASLLFRVLQVGAEAAVFLLSTRL